MSCGGVREGLTSLASKPRETGLTGLGLKTGGGLDAIKVQAKGTWLHREASVEVKRSHEGGVFIRCLYKKKDKFAPTWAGVIFNNVGIYLFFERGLEDNKRGMGSHPTWWFSSNHPLLLFLGFCLFSHPLLLLGIGIEIVF